MRLIWTIFGIIAFYVVVVYVMVQFWRYDR